MLITLIGFLFALGVLILVHEIGHFMFAKMFNVYCEEFSLGMGKVVYQKKKGETKYSLRAFPIGGYVAMAGEGVQLSIEVEKERTLNGIKNWQKFFVIIGGVTMNFILAVIIVILMFFINGVVVEDPYINVREDSIAAESGLKNNDKILEAKRELYDQNNILLYSDELKGIVVTINSYYDIPASIDIATIIKNNPNDFINKTVTKQKVIFKVERDNNIQNIDLTRESKQEDNKQVFPPFGIMQTTRNVGFFEVFSLSFKEIARLSGLIFVGLGSLLSGEGFENISGPIGIYRVTGEAISYGFTYYLYFIALLSVNLAIFNLLPIPGLDGSRLLVLIVESVTRKKINTKIENTIYAVGLIFLLGLMILVTFKDILDIFK